MQVIYGVDIPYFGWVVEVEASLLVTRCRLSNVSE
jgi:hypothetical protein